MHFLCLFLLKPPVISLQLLITDFKYLPDFVIGKILPHRRFHLDDTERFSMAEHLHILKAFEGIGQDIPLGFLVGVAAFCEYAVGLLDYKSRTSAAFVVAAKVCRNIVDLDSAFLIGTLGSSGKSQREIRLEIRKHLLICIGRSMMRLVDYEIIKFVLSEKLRIKRNALDTSTDYKFVFLLYSITEFTDRYIFPQALESLISLIYKLDGICEEQRPLAESFGIADSCDSLPVPVAW